MSHFGYKRTPNRRKSTSALPPKEALPACLDVNIGRPFESFRPGHGRVTFSRRFVLRLSFSNQIRYHAVVCHQSDVSKLVLHSNDIGGLA